MEYQMAYMSQDHKKLIKAELDKVFAGKGFKWSLGVNNHTSIVLNITSGPIDFFENYNASMRDVSDGRRGQERTDYMQVNTYHAGSQYTGDARQILVDAIRALNLNNHNNSDIQTDYFDVGHYVDVNIGKWN